MHRQSTNYKKIDMPTLIDKGEIKFLKNKKEQKHENSFKNSAGSDSYSIRITNGR